ncbi:DUF1820 family protein [Candidatus Vondammii sp. HM_W22]|nr:DUF1820 family protein [Candidatus Vondammii sp. HM_W22]
MRIFRIAFISHEPCAEAVRQAEIYGFIEIEGLIFGETTSAEERL